MILQFKEHNRLQLALMRVKTQLVFTIMLELVQENLLKYTFTLIALKEKFPQSGLFETSEQKKWYPDTFIKIYESLVMYNDELQDYERAVFYPKVLRFITDSRVYFANTCLESTLHCSFDPRPSCLHLTNRRT